MVTNKSIATSFLESFVTLTFQMIVGSILFECPNDSHDNSLYDSCSKNHKLIYPFSMQFLTTKKSGMAINVCIFLLSNEFCLPATITRTSRTFQFISLQMYNIYFKSQKNKLP